MFISEFITVFFITVNSLVNYVPVSDMEQGSLKGKILLSTDKDVKQEELSNEDKDVSTCGHTVKKENLVCKKDSDGVYGVKWVVIEVDAKGKADKNAEYKLDQKGCTYTPHVLVVKRNGKVNLTNSDDVAHNIHIYAEKNESKNINTKANSTVTEKFSKEEKVKVGCDIHPWMSAYIVVVGNPNFCATTGDDGSFTIDNLPAGKHKVTIWHEELGEVTKEIEIKGGETAELNHTFKK